MIKLKLSSESNACDLPRHQIKVKGWPRFQIASLFIERNTHSLTKISPMVTRRVSKLTRYCIFAVIIA